MYPCFLQGTSSTTGLLNHYRGRELLIFKIFLQGAIPRPSPSKSDNAEFFQQVSTRYLYNNQYKPFIDTWNNKIIERLTQERQDRDATYYTKLIEENYVTALEQYDLVPVRSYDTFMKMRDEFCIRHYKGKCWRFCFKCKDCLYLNDSHTVEVRRQEIDTKLVELETAVEGLEKPLDDAGQPNRQEG
eukprot:TRINITY_DN19217_c0_g1_i2.p1 TRINITY_DN19217_c0_g1~~TRINITY_DN19217_c0_g1_i2.p1  ORF type:complete len:195 (+),score=9.02 TRINITY_DN19217_c0_g1_i2:25-585(+)